jgi:hypothetical protein
MRGDIPLNEDAPVDGEHIVVASFLKESAMQAPPTFKYLSTGFRIYIGEGNMQIFNGQRANSFIHLRKPPTNSGEDFITSIALQQISQRVQKVRPCDWPVCNRRWLNTRAPQQMGRIWRQPVVAIEIHVVSNRDRVAHQLFDLRFQQCVARSPDRLTTN